MLTAKRRAAVVDQHWSVVEHAVVVVVVVVVVDAFAVAAALDAARTTLYLLV